MPVGNCIGYLDSWGGGAEPKEGGGIAEAWIAGLKVDSGIPVPL